MPFTSNKIIKLPKYWFLLIWCYSAQLNNLLLFCQLASSKFIRFNTIVQKLRVFTKPLNELNTLSLVL